MGAYLSRPIFEPESSEGVGRGLSFGASSVQGWRMSQEDAHNCIINFDDDCSLFAVYDGHGGSEVSKYCSLHLPAFIKTLSSYKAGDFKQALIDAFLKFDETLTKADTIEALKQLAQTDSGDEGDEDEVREETDKLREEAKMPLHELLKYYIKAQGILKDKKKESNGTNDKDDDAAADAAAAALPADDSKKDAENSDKKANDSKKGKGKSEKQTSSSKNDNKPAAAPAAAAATAAATAAADDGVGDDNEAVANTTASKTTDQKQPMADDEKKQKDKDENGLKAEGSKSSNGESSECATTTAAATAAGSAAGSASEDVAPSASGLHVVPSASQLDLTPSVIRLDESKPSATRGGRAAAQRARRIITNEENNNNNNNNNNDNGDDEDDDEDSESASDEESEEQDDDDDDEDEDDDAEDFDEEESSEDDEDMENDDDVEVFDSDVPGSGSGSTAVVALLKGDLLTVANAGDSRAVICRNGKAIDLSIDHKPEDAIERMRIERAGGKITADGRVNGGLNLSRAIGDHVYKQNSKMSLQEQMISPLPDVQSIVVDRQTDDFMVLACDGIWNCMTSQEVCDFVAACLKQGDKLTDICEQLFRRCIAPDNGGDGTGCDNMTCIVVCFSGELGQKRLLDESGDDKAPKRSRGDDNTDENTGESTAENTLAAANE